MVDTVDLNRDIKNIARAKQLLLYKSLGKGKLGFSDIDAIFEYHRKYLLIVECKVGRKTIELGQGRLIQALVDRWVEPKTLREKLIKLVTMFVPSELVIKWTESPMVLDSYGVKVTHNIPTSEEVLLGDTFIDEIYHPSTKKWVKVEDKIRFEDWFNDLCGSEKWNIQ